MILIYKIKNQVMVVFMNNICNVILGISKKIITRFLNLQIAINIPAFITDVIRIFCINIINYVVINSKTFCNLSTGDLFLLILKP